MGIALRLTAVHVLLLYKKVNFRSSRVQVTVSNVRNSDKSDLGYRMRYSLNGTDNDLAACECAG